MGSEMCIRDRGKPINKPSMVNVQVVLDKGYTLTNVRADVKSIVDEEVANVSRLTNLILNGKTELF